MRNASKPDGPMRIVPAGCSIRDVLHCVPIVTSCDRVRSGTLIVY